MNRFFLLIAFMVLSMHNTLFVQVETEHFVYVPTKGGGVRINPKNEINPILSKGEAVLDLWGYNGNIPWHDDARVKPLQELIDKGILSKQRMRELAGKEPIRVESYFDETGIVKYVHFWLPNGEKTLLTDEELYAICKAYKGVLYDLSHAKVDRSETGSKTVFYCSDFFDIPFEDLKY